MQHRIGLRKLNKMLKKIGSDWSPVPYGTTVGELLVSAVFIGLTIWWVVFWRLYYPRIVKEAGVQATGKCCLVNSSIPGDPPELQKCVR
jgi:hypothetical protein